MRTEDQISHDFDQDASVECVNGHVVVGEADFCPECGSPIGGATDAVARNPGRHEFAQRSRVPVQSAEASSAVVSRPQRVTDAAIAESFVIGTDTSRGLLRARTISTRAWITGVVVVAVVFGVVAAFGFTSWRRALGDETRLAAANSHISQQNNTITGLNSQISDLQKKVDSLSSDLSAAQDEAAVNGEKADTFQRATQALSAADDLMHQAVADIARSASAMGSGDYISALSYINDAKDEVDQANTYEAEAVAALHNQ